MEKLLVTSNFSFSHSVFYPFRELPDIFNKYEIVVCKLIQLRRVENFSFEKGLTLNSLPNDLILDGSKLKAFTNDKINMKKKNWNIFLEWEKSVWTGDKYWFTWLQALPPPTYFLLNL